VWKKADDKLHKTTRGKSDGPFGRGPRRRSQRFRAPRFHQTSDVFKRAAVLGDDGAAHGGMMVTMLEAMIAADIWMNTSCFEVLLRGR